jgi:uncharacterized protein (TIGR02996 family)
MQTRRDRGGFLATIRAAPDDLTTRLVYADWLDEQGDAEGELVRLVCEVRSSNYDDGPAWRRLESQVGGVDAEIGRLDQAAQRLLGCDCAERVLAVFRRHAPDDGRAERAVAAARRFAVGAATGELTASTERLGSDRRSCVDIAGPQTAAWVQSGPDRRTCSALTHGQ